MFLFKLFGKPSNKVSQVSQKLAYSFNDLPQDVIRGIIELVGFKSTYRINKKWYQLSKEVKGDFHRKIREEFPKQYERLKKKKQYNFTKQDYDKAREESYYYLNDFEKKVFDAFKAGDLELVKNLRDSDPGIFLTALHRFDTEGMNPAMWCFQNFQLNASKTGDNTDFHKHKVENYKKTLEFIYKHALVPEFQILKEDGGYEYANKKLIMGLSLIHWVVICNHPEEISKLVEAGFDINQTTGQFEINSALKTFCYYWHPLYFAVKLNNLVMVDHLIQHKANINHNYQISSKAFYPSETIITSSAVLHLAAKQGNIEMVQKLVDNGAHIEMFSEHPPQLINFKTMATSTKAPSDKQELRAYYTSILHAVKHNYLHIAEYLMKRGNATTIPQPKSYHNQWQKYQINTGYSSRAAMRLYYQYEKSRPGFYKAILTLEKDICKHEALLKSLSHGLKSPAQVANEFFKNYFNYYNNYFHPSTDKLELFIYSRSRHHKKAINDICNFLSTIEQGGVTDTVEYILNYLKSYYEDYSKEYQEKNKKKINPKGMFASLFQIVLGIFNDIKEEQENISHDINNNNVDQNSIIQNYIAKYR